MVLDHDGYRYCQYPPHHHPISSTLAVLSLNHLLRFEHMPLLLRLRNLRPKVHSLPRNMESHDSRSYQFPVSGNDSDGVRDTDQHVGLCMRPCLGFVGGDSCMGPVDSGRCCICDGHFINVDTSVSFPPLHTLVFTDSEHINFQMATLFRDGLRRSILQHLLTYEECPKNIRVHSTKSLQHSFFRLLPQSWLLVRAPPLLRSCQT